MYYFILDGKWNISMLGRQNFPKTFKFAFIGFNSILDFCVQMHLYSVQTVRFLGFKPPYRFPHQKIIRFSSFYINENFAIEIPHHTQYTVNQVSILVTSGNKIDGIQTMCM